MNTVKTPDMWAQSTLAEICHKLQYGWTTKASNSGQGPRLLRTTDISNGSIDWSSVPFCANEPTSPDRYLLHNGDIVVSRAGSVGVSSLIGDGPTAVFASYLIRMRPLDDMDSRFVSYFLSSPSYWEQILEQSAGIALQNVNAKKLAAISIPIAPLPEQRRIVAEIETQFTRLDASVAALRQAQANLKRYRASVLRAACSGELVPTEAELARAEDRGYEPADVLLERILAERRTRWESQEKRRGKYKDPAAPDTSDLPTLPEGWAWATVDQLASTQPNSLTDGPFGSNLKTAHYTDEGPRVIRLQNIGDGEFIDAYAHIAEDHFRSLAKHQVFAGNLVIASLGDVLPRSCVIPDSVGPAIVKADCIKFEPSADLASAKYLNVALNARQTRRRVADIVHGIGRPRLNLRAIRGLSLPVPPLAEQRRIVAEVERRLSVVQQAETAVEASRRRAERLRQSILKRAFAGELVPQDPNDEPASVLLERIRAQRETEPARASASKKRPARRRRSKTPA